MYLNILSRDAALAYDRDLQASAEQDRRLAIARQSQNVRRRGSNNRSRWRILR